MKSWCGQKSNCTFSKSLPKPTLETSTFSWSYYFRLITYSFTLALQTFPFNFSNMVGTQQVPHLHCYLMLCIYRIIFIYSSLFVCTSWTYISSQWTLILKSTWVILDVWQILRMRWYDDINDKVICVEPHKCVRECGPYVVTLLNWTPLIKFIWQGLGLNWTLEKHVF